MSEDLHQQPPVVGGQGTHPALEGLDLSMVTAEERQQRIQMYDYMQEHKGHEEMHSEMLLIILCATMFAQIALQIWQKYHKYSYNRVTLFAMWQVPFWFCVVNGCSYMLHVWGLFTCFNAYILYLSYRKSMSSDTPRFVYKYFVVTYKILFGMGSLGYFIFLMQFFGFFAAFDIKIQEHIVELAVNLLFYGLYYGCVNRDFAEICSEEMASKIGFYTQSGIPDRLLQYDKVCCVCGEQCNNQGFVDDVVSLTCGHMAHDFCIRGWCIVGKKSVCPYCKEKVDFSKITKSPWTNNDIRFANLLDWVRYLVAWQPIVFFSTNRIFKWIGLE